MEKTEPRIDQGHTAAVDTAEHIPEIPFPECWLRIENNTWSASLHGTVSECSATPEHHHVYAVNEKIVAATDHNRIIHITLQTDEVMEWLEQHGFLQDVVLDVPCSCGEVFADPALQEQWLQILWPINCKLERQRHMIYMDTCRKRAKEIGLDLKEWNYVRRHLIDGETFFIPTRDQAPATFVMPPCITDQGIADGRLELIGLFHHHPRGISVVGPDGYYYAAPPTKGNLAQIKKANLKEETMIINPFKQQGRHLNNTQHVRWLNMCQHQLEHEQLTKK